ncbi:MAG TPA: SMC-Scp complex subunit ScpB [Planctomycetota bacterium]|nr:SMC-Scp complex subunit ScpB [Planctomycetota bacterium]
MSDEPSETTISGDAATTAPAEATTEAPAATVDGASAPAEAMIETFSVETLADGQQQLIAAEQPQVVPDTSDLPPEELRAVIEALLFVATRPLAIERIAECLPGTGAGYLDGFLAGLGERYAHENRGWELRRLAGGWQLMTRRALHPWVRQLERKELPTRLSKSALETLAIVAYKQPITRGEVEDIRGVQCGPVLRQLMDLKLVQVNGRAEESLGRPLLYGTTEHFLSRFGLGGIGDLPKKHEFGV